ncbi:TPA: hypothetical protein ACLRJ8_002231, partial [Neisseria meningitidis]
TEDDSKPAGKKRPLLNCTPKVGHLTDFRGCSFLWQNIQMNLDSDFKCNTSVLVVGTDSRIKHLAFRSQVFFLVGGSTHLEPCVSPDY